MPSGATIVTARITPSFQRIVGARIGSSPVRAAPRMPDAVQLMKPGACGDVPVMSSVRLSPDFVAVTHDVIEPICVAIVLDVVASAKDAVRQFRQRLA